MLRASWQHDGALRSCTQDVGGYLPSLRSMDVASRLPKQIQLARDITQLSAVSMYSVWAQQNEYQITKIKMAPHCIVLRNMITPILSGFKLLLFRVTIALEEN